jgi:hypothetical protein
MDTGFVASMVLIAVFFVVVIAAVFCIRSHSKKDAARHH